MKTALCIFCASATWVERFFFRTVTSRENLFVQDRLKQWKLKLFCPRVPKSIIASKVLNRMQFLQWGIEMEKYFHLCVFIFCVEIEKTNSRYQSIAAGERKEIVPAASLLTQKITSQKSFFSRHSWMGRITRNFHRFSFFSPDDWSQRKEKKPYWNAGASFRSLFWAFLGMRLSPRNGMRFGWRKTAICRFPLSLFSSLIFFISLSLSS